MTAPKTKSSTNENTSPSGVDAILRSMLDNEAFISDLEKVFVAEVLDKLKSGEISKITDLLLLGFSVDIVLKKFQKLQILINDPGIPPSTEIKKSELKRSEAFKRKYRITEEDILLLRRASIERISKRKQT